MNKKTPASTDSDGSTAIRPTDAHAPESIDHLSPEELADYLYDLAEKVIADPLAYKIEFGLSELDIADFDNLDLSTPEGRKKLAKLFRLLAKQVFKGKDIYLKSIRDTSQQKGQSR